MAHPTTIAVLVRLAWLGVAQRVVLAQVLGALRVESSPSGLESPRTPSAELVPSQEDPSRSFTCWGKLGGDPPGRLKASSRDTPSSSSLVHAGGPCGSLAGPGASIYGLPEQERRMRSRRGEETRISYGYVIGDASFLPRQPRRYALLDRTRHTYSAPPRTGWVSRVTGGLSWYGFDGVLALSPVRPVPPRCLWLAATPPRRPVRLAGARLEPNNGMAEPSDDNHCSNSWLAPPHLGG